MISTDHTAIKMARNRVRIQHKVYLYEAEINMLDGFAGGTVSDNTHAIVASFLRKTGKKMDFLKKRDLNRINELHRAITAIK
jgi:hypothetical protein